MSITSQKLIIPVRKEDFLNKYQYSYEQEFIQDIREDLFELSTECTLWLPGDYESSIEGSKNILELTNIIENEKIC